MSADYYRATNRILSKRAERDLNAFPLARCCNSWMLGNKFQTSFPSLHSQGCFILKQMKNLRQSDLCREKGTFTDITCICICTHRHTGQILQTLKAVFFATLSMQRSLQGSSASYLRISQCRYDKASAGLQPLQRLQWLFLSWVLVKGIQFRNGWAKPISHGFIVTRVVSWVQW